MELKILVGLIAYLIGSICSVGIIIYIAKTLKEAISLLDLIWSFLLSWFQVILFILVSVARWLDDKDTLILDFTEKDEG